MNEESLMENLTLTMKVAKPHTIDPLEGHTVVIFEQVGSSGEEFRFEIAPGQTAPVTKPTLFETLRGRKPPTYFAYAVTGLPELRWQFTADVTLDIQTHSFTLLVTLAYSVSEPRILVTRRNDDPIRQVRDHVTSLLARQFAQRTWLEVLQNFRSVERVVVASIVPLVQQYAAQFGIHVHDLELNHRLTDIDIQRIVEEEEAEQEQQRARRKGKVDRTRIEEEAETVSLQDSLQHRRAVRERQRVIDQRPHDLKISNFHREDMVNDALAEATVSGIKILGTAIQTPADFQAFMKMQGAETHSAIEGRRNNSRQLLAEGGNGQNGAESVIAEALETTERMGLLRSQKQKLQSAILHIVAEVLLDDAAADEVIQRHVAQVDEIRREPKLAMEHADYLKQFVHFEILRDTLR